MGGANNTLLRLNKALATKPMRLRFPYAKVTHSNRFGSNRYAVVVQIETLAEVLKNGGRVRMFHWEAYWGKDPTFEACISQSWQ